MHEDCLEHIEDEENSARQTNIDRIYGCLFTTTVTLLLRCQGEITEKNLQNGFLIFHTHHDY